MLAMRAVSVRSVTTGVSFFIPRKACSFLSSIKPAQVEKKSLILPDDVPLVLKSPVSPAFVTKKATLSPHPPPARLILIDGKTIIYRAYYKLTAKLQYGTLEDLNADGDWVLTVFTALSTILRILELNPSHAAVIFDHEGLTFRHTLFPDYKRNRSPTPDTVVQALQYVKPALVAMAIKVIEVPGVEADDVIGTLATKGLNASMKVRVVSSDKDFFQLISPSLRLLRFVPRGSGIVSFGHEEFELKFGSLLPSQFVDFLSLVGDPTDNIPGVEGIGEKTAIRLLQEFGTLEKLVEDRSKVEIKRARKGLENDAGAVLDIKRLVTLRTDLPFYMVPFTLDDLEVHKPEDDGSKFFNLVRAMGSFVDTSVALGIEDRAKELWRRNPVSDLG